MRETRRLTQVEQMEEIDKALTAVLMAALAQSAKKSMRRRGSAKISEKTVESIRRLRYEAGAKKHVNTVLKTEAPGLVAFLIFRGNSGGTLSVRPKSEAP